MIGFFDISEPSRLAATALEALAHEFRSRAVPAVALSSTLPGGSAVVRLDFGSARAARISFVPNEDGMQISATISDHGTVCKDLGSYDASDMGRVGEILAEMVREIRASVSAT
ncbi:MAG: hypothetical protein WCK58_00345 [Chloroflexota bacterium]